MLNLCPLCVILSVCKMRDDLWTSPDSVQDKLRLPSGRNIQRLDAINNTTNESGAEADLSVNNQSINRAYIQTTSDSVGPSWSVMISVMMCHNSKTQGKTHFFSVCEWFKGGNLLLLGGPQQCFTASAVVTIQPTCPNSCGLRISSFCTCTFTSLNYLHIFVIYK